MISISCESSSGFGTSRSSCHISFSNSTCSGSISDVHLMFPRSRNMKITSCHHYKEQTFPCRFSPRSEEHTSELQSRFDLVCRLLLEKKNHTLTRMHSRP